MGNDELSNDVSRHSEEHVVDVGGTVAVDVGGGVTSQVTQTKEEPIKDEADDDIASKLLDILRKS